VLRGHDTTQTGDVFDRIKYIPLSDDGKFWVSFGGQARFRLEVWNNFNFAPAIDDELGLFRFRAHTDVHLGEHVRVFIEGKSAFSADNDLPEARQTALDEDNLDLQNGFVDVSFDVADNVRLTIRVGRQELLFGKQRLASPLDWANNRRTFDGVSLIINAGDWRVTGFWVMFVPTRKYEFNQSDAQHEFFGVYAEGVIPNTNHGIDLYFLGLSKDAAAVGAGFNGTAGREERYTIGARVFAKVLETDRGALDYDIEAAFQFGEVGSGDISAWMVASEIGYTLKQVKTTPRLHVGLDYASGDDEVGGDVETFNQLFPLGHAYLGWIDTVGRQNIIDASAGVTVKPHEKVTVLLVVHNFWRASDDDALYNAGGGVVRAGSLAGDAYVGTELDLLVKVAATRRLQILVGYSHFFAGNFIDNATPTMSDDIDFFYTQVQFTF